MTAQIRPVVVGVDGSAANAGALRFAIEEARRTRARLTLIHVAPDFTAVSPIVPLTSVDLTEAARAVLTQAEKQVREVAPDLEVESWLHQGARVTQLAGAARRGQVLVVGRDDRSLMERLLSGDTAAAVAARASVPVVVVPAEWRPASGGGVVVVGVKSPKHADALLDDAMAVAAERGARLVALHAWKLPNEYDDIIESRVTVDEWQRRSVAELDRLLADWRVSYPEVAVETRVVHDRPARALVEASREADLVVIVRRAHGVPAATHLGGVARAVIRSAKSAVRVVPPGETVPVPGLVVEQAGSIRK